MNFLRTTTTKVKYFSLYENNITTKYICQVFSKIAYLKNLVNDFGFYKERISGSFDVYKRTTNDLLNSVPIPGGTNFSNYLLSNVGSLENKGFEATLVLRPISTADMSWEIATNLTYNHNEITKLTTVDDPDYVGVLNGRSGR